jgi:protein O-mannosyl-transferase
MATPAASAWRSCRAAVPALLAGLHRLQRPLLGLALAALTLVTFAGLGSDRFQFINLDDPDFVTENPHVQAGLTPQSIAWAWTTTHAYYWFPATWLSLELDTELYGKKPWGYHVTNVLLHTGSVVLLFLALDGMTGAPGRCALVAALFAVHPLRVESVAWIAERKDVLCTFWWMATLLAYAWYAERPSLPRYGMVLAAFTLGLLSKPMIVTLGAVLLLLDWWPLQRLWLGDPGRVPTPPVAARFPPVQLRWLLLEKVPLLLLAAGITFVTLRASHDLEMNAQAYPLELRIGNAVVSYVRYLGKLAWPAELAVFYPHPGAALPWWQAAGAALLLILLTAPFVWAGRHRPYLAVGWLWFLGTLLPVIGLVQLTTQAMADRFVYVPSVGILLVVIWGGADLALHFRARWPAIVLALLAVAACVPATWAQLAYWQNSRALWTHALEVTGEHNPTAQNHLGGALLEEEDLDGAEAHLTAAVRDAPGYTIAWYNLGVVAVRRNQLDRARDCFEAAVQSRPNHRPSLYALGLVLEEQGRTKEAEACFARERQLRAGDSP